MPKSTDYYVSLIPSWNASRPKFREMVRGLSEPGAEAQEGIYKIRDAFDLDTAVGAQLDLIGEWIGVSRVCKEAIPDVYFSFDNAALGFDRGYFIGPYDSPTAGVTMLGDEIYRSLLKSKAQANLWDGTIPGAAPAYDALTSGAVIILDNQDMTMTVAVAGTLTPPIILQLLLQGYVPLKPMGVLINYVLVSSATPLFGFDNNNQYIAGFDIGAWGVPV